MQFADGELSARLETMTAAEMRRFIDSARRNEALSEAAYVDIAGGTVAYLSPGSPINQAVGIGTRRAVAARDARAIDAFFAERGESGTITVSPHAHPSTLLAMGEQGWRAAGFENVLIREYALDETFDRHGNSIEIIEARDAEKRSMWAHLAALGFSAPEPPNPAQLELARVVSMSPGSRHYIAFLDGRPCGTGELFCQDEIAWLSADSTLPDYRQRGVQRALQLRRLADGARDGCSLAVSESVPGSASQRNMERLGFRVAYTRVDLIGPCRR